MAVDKLPFNILASPDRRYLNATAGPSRIARDGWEIEGGFSGFGLQPLLSERGEFNVESREDVQWIGRTRNELDARR